MINNMKWGKYLIVGSIVILDFKDKTRYTPYVSLRSQISHIATNEV